METNNKIKNNLYVVIVAVIIALVSYFYLINIIRNKQNGDLSMAIAKLQEMELAQRNFSTNERLLNETKKEREDLNSLVVNKKTIANFIEQIEMLGNHANVEVTKNISIDKNTQMSKESMLKVNIRAKGNFNDVYYFTLLMENIPYKIRIKKIALATSDANISSLTSGLLPVLGTSARSVAIKEPWVSDISLELLSYINE